MMTIAVSRKVARIYMPRSVCMMGGPGLKSQSPYPKMSWPANAGHPRKSSRWRKFAVGRPHEAGHDSWDDGESAELAPLPLERRRRGAHRFEAAGADREHGEAALDRAVRVEAEDAVDAGEAVGIGEGCGREALIGLAAAEQRDQRHCVIGKGRERRRRAAERGAVFGDEAAVGLRRRGGEPAVAKRRLARDGEIVP